jgi:predicted phage terminase large subunit-like protein
MTNSPPSPPVSPQQAAAELLRRRRARGTLLDFTTYTKPDYQVGWHHRLLCDTLDRFAAGLVPRLIVCVPPQHGKTELVVRRLAPYLLGRDPDCRVISCSYGSSLASDGNRDVQRVVDDDPYRRLFPATRIGGDAVRNSDVFEVVGRAGFYRSAGVGGPITGRPMDVGLIDDPFKNREEADSPVVREAVWNWYTSAFLSRAHRGTRILVCHTRWHPDDLVGRLLRQQRDDPKADRWEVLSLPALCKEAGDGLGSPRQVGDALWPERHPPELLERKRAASPYDWFSLYQQEPRSPGSQEWPDELFPPSLWFDDWPGGMRRRVLSLDPSKGRSDKSGDYSAFVMLALDDDWTLWVDADLARRPVEASAERSIVGDGLELLRRWNPEAFSVETNGFQSLVADAFLRVARERGVHCPLYPVESTDPKTTRIRQLGPYLAQKRLRVRNTPGGRMLVEQLRLFPNAEHDDGPDALAQAVVTMDHLVYGRRDDDAGGVDYLRV